jgi:hypothetical protein
MMNRKRDDDWERAEVKMYGTLKFLVFYSIIAIFGGVFFALGVWMLMHHEPWWGHTLFELIGGGLMLLISPFAFLNDTAGFRGKLYD